MDLFNNEKNEEIAISFLKNYDIRYKNLKKSECPDYISETDSIGVEVTVVEFDNFIDSIKYINKSLVEYIRMKGVKKIQKKNFKFINEVIQENYSTDVKDEINRFIDSFYYKDGVNILKIESIEQYNKLDPNTNLYFKSEFPNEKLVDNQIINNHLPSFFWEGEIVNNYINAAKRKNQKLKKYRQFDENSLLIINYTAGQNESLDFEKRIKEIDGINFDKIFVFNALFNKHIYEIDLRKS